MRGRSGGLDLAIDLGTAATRLHVASRVSPLSRPSVVWRLGIARPALRGGAVVDTEAAADVVGDLLRAVPRRRWRRPSALACVPSDASPEERAAVVEAVQRAGAGPVEVAPEPLAAALGAGLEVAAARAGIVVDVGEGVTDCALLRGGAVAASDALRVAVADLRAAIREWTSECLGVRISPVEAERVLREVGVARETLRPQRTLRVVGRPRQGLGPVRIELEVDAALAAVAPVAERIEAHVGRFLAGLPTESRETEVCVSGGGALLPGLLERLEERTQRRIRRAPDPVRSVIDGARRIAAGAAGL